MNGDISRIPIQTLGAVLSLTDILPEIPFPTACASNSINNGLIYDDEIAATANNPNKPSELNSLISQALVHTSTDNLSFKGEANLTPKSIGDVPPLLADILRNNKLLLQDKLGFKEIYRSLIDIDTYQSPGTSGAPSYADESSELGYGRKKKKKKKKKKRKFADDSYSDNSGEDVSKTSENESGRIVSVVKVDNNTENKKISLKISFKKPSTPTTISDENADSKKDRKKHRHHHHKDKITYKKNDLLSPDQLPQLHGNDNFGEGILTNGDDYDLNEICLFDPKIQSNVANSISNTTNTTNTVNHNNNPDTSFIDQFIQDNPIPFNPNHHASSNDIALVEDLFKNEIDLQESKNKSNSTLLINNVGNCNNNTNSLANNLCQNDDPILKNGANQINQDSSYILNDILMNDNIGGLESYLNASNSRVIPTENPEVRNNNPKALPNQGCKPRPQLKRNLPGSLNSNQSNNKRGAPKRRKNELEGLQSWKVNYSKVDMNIDQSGVPGKEDGWNKTLNNLSSSMHERAKRRKRNAPNMTSQSNSNFIYEEDDDYYDKSPMNEQQNLNGTTTLNVIGHSSDGEGVKLKSPESRRNPKSSYVEVDSDSESNHRKKKKNEDEDEDFAVRVKEKGHFGHSDQQKKMRQRLDFRNAVVDDEMRILKPANHFTNNNNNEDGESSVEANLNRFTTRVDSIFENIEETDLIHYFQNDEDSKSMNSKIPPETIISINDLMKICQDTNKLKAMKISNMVEKEKMIKLLSVLILNIRDGQGVVATFRQDESSENDNKLWRELAMERVLRSILSTEIGLHLMTSMEMPKEIYLEDFLEKAVQIVRFQLNNTIFPEYDPVYRIDSSCKDNLTSIKGKRSRHKVEVKMKATIQLYHRIVECISELGELVNIQRLTDGIVLTLSSIGVSVFFVENVNELQLAGLKLLTAIFFQYEAHRKLIIEDILASLSRLPTSKKNLRTYRLNSEDSIQMLTALALMLVQSVSLPTFQQKTTTETDKKSSQEATSDPATTSAPTNQGKDKKPNEDGGGASHDEEMKILMCYKNSMRTAHMFLSAFLRKSTLKGEDDHRAIFENFVNDLLLTVNKPEWPAAEVMLSMLGTLLVQQFNNKNLDQTTRVTSVDYLGTVASTLRRDAVTSQLREKDIDNIIKGLLHGKEDESDDDCISDNDNTTTTTSKDNPTIPKQKTLSLFAKMDRIQALRDALLDYLMDASDDPTAIYARRFYISQWLNDCTREHEKARTYLNALKDPRRDSIDEDDEEASEILRTSRQEATNLQQADRRRKYISSRALESVEVWKRQRRLRTNPLVHLNNIASGQRTNGQLFGVVYKSIMDYEDACIICKYLASMRPFSQSFDIYLSQICKLLSETSVAVRTKALRCLSAVVEADPDILARADIEKAVHARLLDTSTSVREAAIDLLGRFISCKPELSIRYYTMFSDRILDKGVSVRKRVIKILRDICLEQPEFPKIPEICVKMIRRINDEEGIKKLVQDVFQTMWFTPVRERDSMKLYRRVMNITDVVSACQKTGLEWFEQFLQNLLKKEETEKTQPVEKACTQIVDCLMQNVIRLEEVSEKSNKRLLACLATLHLITNIRPEFMIEHAMQLQPYLAINCSGSSDMQIVHHVSRILELTVPLMEHPSESMISKLEEEMVFLTLKYGKLVLEACVGCLGSIVNRVSKNFQLVRDCFHRFYSTLVKCRQEVQSQSQEASSIGFCPTTTIPMHHRSSLMRALFTVGLLCKHFNPEVLERNESDKNLLNSVFENLMFFLEFSVDDLPLRKNALSGLGFLCARHHRLLIGTKLTKFYQYLLQFPASPPQLSLEERRQRLPVAARHLKEIGDSSTSQEITVLDLKCLVLENLLNFFHEEEKRMLDHDSKWKIVQNNESLKEMGDVASGTGSLVAQTYLRDILESFYIGNVNVRLIALSVITTILKQGLIHPIVTVPYLISMQTDTDPNVRVKADSQLLEIETKFPGFVNMRAAQGISLSYRLQFVLYSEVTSDQFKLKQQEAANIRLNSALGEIHSTGNMASNNKKQNNSNINNSLNMPRRSARNNNTRDEEDSIDGQVIQTSSTGSLQLQSPQESFGAVRGSWNPESEVPSALNSQLYTMLRANRGQRRAFLNNLLNLFDDNNVRKRCSLRRLIYIADNLAYFPYQNQDEPLYLVHHIDLLVGTIGTNLLSSVRDSLFPEAKTKFEELCNEKARLEAEARHQMENQLRESIGHHQIALQQAMMRQDHATAQMEQLTLQSLSERLQQTIAFNNTSNTTTNPLLLPQKQPQQHFGAFSQQHNNVNNLNPMNHSISAKDYPKFVACLIDPEEEENEEILISRLERYSQTAMQTMREAIHSSRACILLIMLKQYLREVYSITDAKIQKYSPTDAAKVWERPLTRKVGVRFHPVSCLKISGRQLTSLLHSLHDKWSELWKYDDSPLMRHYRKPPMSSLSSIPGGDLLTTTGGAGSTSTTSNEFVNYFNDDHDELDNNNPSDLMNNPDENGIQALIQEYLEFRKIILSVEHISANDDDLMNGLDPSTNMEGISMPKASKRSTTTTIVGQINDSDDCQDSDSDGGASRLMLAKSAPQRPKGGGGGGGGQGNRPKRGARKKAVIDISSDENHSSLSDASNA